jgi:2-polyprenyl-3-methyl-5-hydroxy-6-metoxy-1,4-benzoquinol methylase
LNIDLRNVESHFQFGENWQHFSATLDRRDLEKAVQSLSALLPADVVRGKSVLDIGSGSGLSAAAAFRLGARHVTAVDIDERSVSATRGNLQKFAPGGDADVRILSVFDLESAGLGKFDIVHSWGVLHHTGNLDEALACAARCVADGGVLALALYRRTAVDRLWVIEKRIYTNGSKTLRKIFRAVFKLAYLMSIGFTGRSPWRYIREYGRNRGMDWAHDIHDWLGGYPYQSIEADELNAQMAQLGFTNEIAVVRPVAALGVFGAPCNEYRFRRKR